MSRPEPPGRGMSFAETQLRRQGWRRGRGLGKREDGIAEAIRVKVKCDTAGVGHDPAEPFSFHWWDHLFNKAAANITVEDGEDGISMKTLSKDGVRISNKKPCKAPSASNMLYGRFVKSATLTAQGEESTRLPTGSESSDEEEEEKLDLSSARRLTDQELMRACGGRTAHKGARHGLTMSAKLARLEEQERAFLAAYQQERQHQLPGSNLPAERQGKKKKRKKSRDGDEPEVLQSQEPSGEEEVAGEEGKGTERKKRKSQEPSTEEEVAEEEGKGMKRKKKKGKNQEPSTEEEVAGEDGMKRKKQKENKELEETEKQQQDKEELAETEGKKRKKKKQQQEDKEEPGEPEVEKRKKKKKKKQQQEDKEEPAETEVHPGDTDGPGHSPRKKKKKKRKREPE